MRQGFSRTRASPLKNAFLEMHVSLQCGTAVVRRCMYEYVTQRVTRVRRTTTPRRIRACSLSLSLSLSLSGRIRGAERVMDETTAR